MSKLSGKRYEFLRIASRVVKPWCIIIFLGQKTVVNTHTHTHSYQSASKPHKCVFSLLLLFFFFLFSFFFNSFYNIFFERATLSISWKHLYIYMHSVDGWLDRMKAICSQSNLQAIETKTNTVQCSSIKQPTTNNQQQARTCQHS